MKDFTFVLTKKILFTCISLSLLALSMTACVGDLATTDGETAWQEPGTDDSLESLESELTTMDSDSTPPESVTYPLCCFYDCGRPVCGDKTCFERCIVHCGTYGCSGTTYPSVVN